jgi:uncharacterized protein YoxC
MTIALILAAAIVLAVVYQILYKKGSGTINQIKRTATDALDKIEPVLQEAGEVIEKAKKVAPKNEVVKKASKAAKDAKVVVKQAKKK